MLGLQRRAGFEVVAVTGKEAEDSELQFAKRLVSDRGRDLDLILPGSLEKYDIRQSLVGPQSYSLVQSEVKKP